MTDPRGEAAAVRAAALRLLARREHSREELRGKLAARDFPLPLVQETLSALADEGWLSDARFIESFMRARAARGYGPLRIAQELRERGVDEEAIARRIEEAGIDWREQLAAARSKRFGQRVPADYAEWARQARYLQARGFAVSEIRRLLPRP